MLPMVPAQNPQQNVEAWELKQAKMKNDQLQQENLRLRQQIIDQEIVHETKVVELKASHKVQIDKLNKLYES